MNRRGFLQAILAAGVAPAVVGSGVLMPVRAISKISGIWVPPNTIMEADGELLINYSSSGLVSRANNCLLTVSEITQEALRLVERNLLFAASQNANYDDLFRHGDHPVLNINRPSRFASYA